MALSAKLQQKQSQSLVMTPQLLQSIRLLQYGNLELQAFVQRELEKNPLLEQAEPEDEKDGDRDLEPDAPADSGDISGDMLETTVASVEERLGTSLENVFDHDRSGFDGDAGRRPEQRERGDWLSAETAHSLDGDAANLEAYCASQPTLRDHLRDQLPMAVHDGTDAAIAGVIIESLDDDGYLRRPVPDLAESLNVSPQRLEAVLKMVQSLDPCGIGARDLRECLALQLAQRDRLDPAMAVMLENLDLLARRDFAGLARLCRVDMEDIREMVREIRELDPRPGSRFDPAPVMTAAPDVFVTPRSDGGWDVELNSQALPKVLVNREYFARIVPHCRNETEKTFLVDCLQSANWLVKSLDQRAQTILKVAAEIVKKQDAFLAYGVEHLRPLNLKTVADAIQMHESTVSRVTAGKYMMTGRGLFEMKYFFTNAIAATGGEASHSAEAVRHRIRLLVESEKPDKILSDDTIVRILRDAGVDIARRTVAKYRESLSIPSSVHRRREKQMSLTDQAG